MIGLYTPPLPQPTASALVVVDLFCCLAGTDMLAPYSTDIYMMTDASAQTSGQPDNGQFQSSDCDDHMPSHHDTPSTHGHESPFISTRLRMVRHY
jgi:hypothetical protein